MSDETTAAPGQTPARPETPELLKQRLVADESQRIGEFLDWLGEQGIRLARYGEHDRLWAIHQGPEALLAGFYGIDLAKIDQERRALLEHLRREQKS